MTMKHKNTQGRSKRKFNETYDINSVANQLLELELPSKRRAIHRKQEPTGDAVVGKRAFHWIAKYTSAMASESNAIIEKESGKCDMLTLLTSLCDEVIRNIMEYAPNYFVLFMKYEKMNFLYHGAQNTYSALYAQSRYITKSISTATERQLKKRKFLEHHINAFSEADITFFDIISRHDYMKKNMVLSTHENIILFGENNTCQRSVETCRNCSKIIYCNCYNPEKDETFLQRITYPILNQNSRKFTTTGKSLALHHLPTTESCRLNIGQCHDCFSQTHSSLKSYIRSMNDDEIRQICGAHWRRDDLLGGIVAYIACISMNCDSRVKCMDNGTYYENWRIVYLLHEFAKFLSHYCRSMNYASICNDSMVKSILHRMEQTHRYYK